MASQSVIIRKRSLDQVVQATLLHADTIEKGLNEAIAEDLAPGEAPVRWGVGVRALGRGLERKFQRLEAADTANEDEQLDDAEPRARRDAHARTSHGAVVDLRDGIRGTYGSAAEAKLGVSGTTPRDPQAILLVGKQVLPRVEGAVAGQVLRAGFSFDPTPAKTRLLDVLPLLELALLDVAREGKEADVTLMEKQAALAAYDRMFSIVANVVSVLLAAIGEHELAARVRPSERHPGRTEAEEEIEGDVP